MFGLPAGILSQMLLVTESFDFFCMPPRTLWCAACRVVGLAVSLMGTAVGGQRWMLAEVEVGFGDDLSSRVLEGLRVGDPAGELHTAGLWLRYGLRGL